MILNFIEKVRSKGLNIAVVGDIMQDEYHFGSCKRVSPESPALVFNSLINNPTIKPGGAANVCLQLKHWNVTSHLVGFVEEDSDNNYCVKLGRGKVPRKVRFYTDTNEPMPMRWDVEMPNYGDPDIAMLRNKLFHKFRALLRHQIIDVVVFSNYNKGLFIPDLAQVMIRECLHRGIPTIVDPKCAPIDCWKGCTVFKPNQEEAEKMTGHTDWKKQTAALSHLCECVIITQAGNGLIGQDGSFFSYHKFPKQKAISVVGAGDCFAAVLAVALAHDINYRDAAALAFEAGAEYVKHRMNRPIAPHELLARLDKDAAKIVTVDEFFSIKNTILDGQDVIFTNGCYDIIHKGHLATLRFAKKQGHILVVGLNSDESVRRLKGEGRPIQNQQDRASILASLDCVDYVIIFDQDSPEKLIESTRPAVIVKGADYKDKKVAGSQYAEVRYCDLVPTSSTSGIIEKIASHNR